MAEVKGTGISLKFTEISGLNPFGPISEGDTNIVSKV